MPLRAFVFECSTNTYMECVEKGVFGSNKPWPLEVAQGDFCLLHHYEVGTLLALWKADINGGLKIVPKAWGGRFPFQARVTLVSSGIIEVPRKAIDDFVVSPLTGRLDNVLEGERAEGLIQVLRGMTQLRET